MINYAYAVCVTAQSSLSPFYVQFSASIVQLIADFNNISGSMCSTSPFLYHHHHYRCHNNVESINLRYAAGCSIIHNLNT